MAVATALFAACDAAEEDSRTHETQATLTIYLLDGHLSPLGYRGRLAPVQRLVSGKPDAAAAVQALFRGPTSEERNGGLISPVGEAELLSLGFATAVRSSTSRALRRAPSTPAVNFSTR